MIDICHRTAIAQELTRQLLRPGVLELPMRSGLFLSDLCRTGKASFLRQHLIPALEAGDWSPASAGRSIIVIYVDLWSAGVNGFPAQLILGSVRAKLHELATDGFRFNFDVCTVGEKGGATLAEAFSQVVDEGGTDLVLIVDGVQRCREGEDAHALLMALKAARDAVNLRPGRPGCFLFVGAGSPRSLVQNMTVGTEAPFAGAVFCDLSAPFC